MTKDLDPNDYSYNEHKRIKQGNEKNHLVFQDLGKKH